MTQTKQATAKSAESAEFAALYEAGDFRGARELAVRCWRKALDPLTWRHNHALTYWAEEKFQAAKHLYVTGAYVLDASDDDERKGNYHNGFALVLRALGEVDTALIEYEAARYHYERAGQFGHAADVDNNIAFLLLEAGRLSEALEYAARAVSKHLEHGRHESLEQSLDTMDKVKAAINARGVRR